MSNKIQVYDNVNTQWVNLDVSATNNQVLTTDSTATPSGLKWSSPTQGTVTSISGGVGITCTPNPITATGSVAISSTSVVAGDYVLASLTVNAQGQLTAASDGKGNVFNHGVVTLSSSAFTLTDANITATSRFQLTYDASTSFDPSTVGILSYVCSSGQCVISSNHAGDSNKVSYLVFY